MNKVKVLKCHKKAELNPLREQTLDFINSNLPVSNDKRLVSHYKKKFFFLLQ